jgi:hypothetical protein
MEMEMDMQIQMQMQMQMRGYLSSHGYKGFAIER